MLSRDERAVIEGERKVRGQSGHVAQPQFEKSHLYQDQLIVLAEIYETCKTNNDTVKNVRNFHSIHRRKSVEIFGGVKYLQYLYSKVYVLPHIPIKFKTGLL